MISKSPRKTLMSPNCTRTSICIELLRVIIDSGGGVCVCMCVVWLNEAKASHLIWWLSKIISDFSSHNMTTAACMRQRAQKRTRFRTLTFNILPSSGIGRKHVIRFYRQLLRHILFIFMTGIRIRNDTDKIFHVETMIYALFDCLVCVSVRFGFFLLILLLGLKMVMNLWRTAGKHN